MVDRFPNYFDGRLDLSAANTFTSTIINLPVPRRLMGGGSQTIIELCWVDIIYDDIDLAMPGDALVFCLSTGSTPLVLPEFGEDSNIILQTRIETNDGSGNLVQPQRIEMQDRAGYGFLVASERMIASGISGGQAAAVSFKFRVYYRYVEVGIEEYVGLVQSRES
jgi:hypothetical protein